jgi:hypothetical protein
MRIMKLRTARVIRHSILAQDCFTIADAVGYAKVAALEEVAGGIKLISDSKVEIFVPWANVDFLEVEPGSLDEDPDEEAEEGSEQTPRQLAAARARAAKAAKAATGKSAPTEAGK